jgi:hypothetical protein
LLFCYSRDARMIVQRRFRDDSVGEGYDRRRGEFFGNESCGRQVCA